MDFIYHNPGFYSFSERYSLDACNQINSTCGVDINTIKEMVCALANYY